MLLHELAHLRRRDALAEAAARAVCALLWFDPLAWIARMLMRRDAEQSCDREVLSHGISRSTYAAALVEVVWGLQGTSPLLAATALGERRALRERIARVLSTPKAPRGLSKRGALAVGAAVCVLAPLLLLSVSLRGEDPLNGTWQGRSAYRPFCDYRLVLKEDGTGQTSLAVLPEVPTSFCRYVVDRKWKDLQGCTCYHLRFRWSDEAFPLYALIRLDPSGTLLEMADSPTGYPAGFLGPRGCEKHLVYARLGGEAGPPGVAAPRS